MNKQRQLAWWRRGLYWLFSQKATSWTASRTIHHLDRVIFPLSGGKSTLLGSLGDLPTFMLTTTGAKSGLERRTPLVGIPDGENIIVIASNWGQERHPSWYHNLRANPEVGVQIGESSGRYEAREAKDDEYDALWEKAVYHTNVYDAYKSRTGGRRIPVVVLSPL